ncbi:MAG: aldo/keto reductase [Lachnospiraceae bacterium]|nr:aldo/keto reductase [Lachnospiraceae bacterium]
MDYRDHFGFGTMRMPVTVKDDPTSFDFKMIESLFDSFIEKGFKYFDTAYTYHGYHAEKAVRKALVERHPREDFELATKLPLRDFKDEENMQQIFNEQLENCGVEYFDYYLLHNMGSNVYDRCVKYKAFEFVSRMKAEGKILNAGMSFHDTPKLLEEILEKYSSCLDFIQLQINYIDWEEANVQSRRCLEIAQKYNKPVIVMEPCKGGTLVNVPDEAAKLMKAFAPERSIASWAMRFAAGCPGVIKVLSGMNSMEQVEDNCSVFADFEPLSEEEMAVIDKVREIIHSNTAIPCTACEYCTHGCPKNIAIPQYFSAYNSIMRTSGSFSSQSVYYNNLVLAGHGKASDCIKCGNCETACPQHLPIREYLETVASKMENTSILPVRR